jgi:hypothetical protein
VSETWHGIVHSVVSKGIYVTIPRLLGAEVLGPCLSAVPGLAEGDRVVGAKIGDQLSDLIILSRAVVAVADETVVHKDGDGAVTLQTVYLNGEAVPGNKAVTQSALDGKANTAHRHPWADLDDVPATFAPSAHTHPASAISDSTATGRSVLTAADAASARSAIGAGTSSLVIGTGATDAMAGNRAFSYTEITGTVPTAALPPLAINDVFQPADQTAMLALTAQRGDMAIRLDNGRSYVLSSDSPGTLADWKEMMAAGQVQSVAGKTGVVSLVKADVGLGAVDNTSDAAKPVSTATQTALDTKANTVHTHLWADITDKPATFTPASHTHAIGDVTGLQAALDAARGGAWTTLTLLGSWAAFTGTGNYFPGLRARRQGDDLQIQGMVKSGAAGTVMATLPSALFPAYSAFRPVVAGTASVPRNIAYVSVTGTDGTNMTGTGHGNIYYDTAGPAAPTFVSIDITIPLV